VPWAKIASNLAKLALQAPATKVLATLQVDSAVLQIIADKFSKIIREDIKVHSFREEKGMSGLYGLDAKVFFLCSSLGFPLKSSIIGRRRFFFYNR